MMDRLNANLNPFINAGPAQRNIFLQTDQALNERAANLKNRAAKQKNQFDDLIVEGEIVGEEKRRPNQRQSQGRSSQDPRYGSAQHMRGRVQFEQARAAAQASRQETMPGVTRQEFEELKSEMKSMRRDLNRLMASKNPAQANQTAQSLSQFNKQEPYNIGFGYGYEIAQA